MKRFIDTLVNIWKIEDLRARILTTLGFLLIYRLGTFIILPGIDSVELSRVQGDPQGLAALLNAFAGGAFSRASIFALGIMPYISASIVMQLLGIALPSLQRLQKEGESGRRKINQWTRFLTVVITAGQAPGYIGTWVPDSAITFDNVGFFWFTSVLLLVTGTIFVMWLGERITDRGIGNGISLLIMIGIIADLPKALAFEFDTRLDYGGMVMFLVEILFLVIVTIVTITHVTSS